MAAKSHSTSECITYGTSAWGLPKTFGGFFRKIWHYTEFWYLSAGNLQLHMLFRSDTRNNFISEKAVGHWHCCPGSGGGVTIPVGVPDHGDVALRDAVSGHGGMGLDLGSGGVFSNLNDPVIQRYLHYSKRKINSWLPHSDICLQRGGRETMHSHKNSRRTQ